MTAFAKKPQCGREAPRLEDWSFCRIVGQEVGPDGRALLLLETITDPREQKAARKRYEAVMKRAFSAAMRRHTGSGGIVGGAG